MLCGRDVPALKPFTETALRVELPSRSAQSLADMRAFFCFRLEKTFGSDPQWKEALERMTARSEGIAMYAQLLCDMLLDKKTLDCEDLPKGLTGMFTVWFEGNFPPCHLLHSGGAGSGAAHCYPAPRDGLARRTDE